MNDRYRKLIDAMEENRWQVLYGKAETGKKNLHM